MNADIGVNVSRAGATDKLRDRGIQVPRFPRNFIRDDRGNAIECHKIRARVSRMGLRRSPWTQLAWTALAVMIAGGVIAAAVYDIIRNGWPKASEFVPYVVIYFACMGVLWCWALVVRFVPRFQAKACPTHGCFEATSLAWGRCAACAHDIHECTPDQDGCATCPTCNAAWQADRWRNGKVAEQDVRHALYGEEQHVDARCVALRSGTFSRGRWNTPSPIEDTSPAVVPSRHERRVMARRAMDRVRERWLLGAALIFGCGFLAAVLVASALGTESDFAKPIARTVPIFVALLVFQVARVRSGRAYARAVLKQGLCPNCGMVLSASARVEFDGCVSCAHCGRAWKAGDVKQPEHGPEHGPEPEVEPNAAFLSFANKLGRTIGRQGHDDA